jgi:hypothetical protein
LLLPLAPVVYTMSGMIVIAGLMHLVLIFVPHAEHAASESKEVTP